MNVQNMAKQANFTHASEALDFLVNQAAKDNVTDEEAVREMAAYLRVKSEIQALQQQLAAANSLLDQRFEELAAAREALAGMTADRDSWCEQAAARVNDWHEAREALRELQQACWDARAAMGFDNDGAATPAALAYPTIPELILRDCREFRKEHDEVCDENTKLERDARAWRNRFIDERMRAYEDKGYEMARCYAESDANDFIDAFHATLQRDRQP